MILCIPANNFSDISGRVFLGWTSTKQRIKCQRSASDETWTHNPSILSQALYHWATALFMALDTTALKI